MERKRLQISLARIAGIFRTLLHNQLCVSICAKRRSETVGKSHQHILNFAQIFFLFSVGLFFVHNNLGQSLLSRFFSAHQVCVFLKQIFIQETI
jgi:hypothetical protein